jgi:hypothetical protein
MPESKTLLFTPLQGFFTALVVAAVTGAWYSFSPDTRATILDVPCNSMAHTCGVLGHRGILSTVKQVTADARAECSLHQEKVQTVVSGVGESCVEAMNRNTERIMANHTVQVDKLTFAISELGATIAKLVADDRSATTAEMTKVKEILQEMNQDKKALENAQKEARTLEKSKKTAEDDLKTLKEMAFLKKFVMFVVVGIAAFCKKDSDTVACVVIVLVFHEVLFAYESAYSAIGSLFVGVVVAVSVYCLSAMGRGGVASKPTKTTNDDDFVPVKMPLRALSELIRSKTKPMPEDDGGGDTVTPTTPAPGGL